MKTCVGIVSYTSNTSWGCHFKLLCWILQAPSVIPVIGGMVYMICWGGCNFITVGRNSLEPSWSFFIVCCVPFYQWSQIGPQAFWQAASCQEVICERSVVSVQFRDMDQTALNPVTSCLIIVECLEHCDGNEPSEVCVAPLPSGPQAHHRFIDCVLTVPYVMLKCYSLGQTGGCNSL